MFYAKIQLLCKKKGVSVRKFEEDLNFSRGSACKWKNSIPSFDKVVNIAEYFEIPLDELKKCLEKTKQHKEEII